MSLFGLFFFVVLMFVLVVQVVNVVVWWSVFVFMDLVFIFVCKNGGGFSVVLNYYVLQECLALIFLVVSSSCLQGLIVMVKMGLLPFHYWLYVVIGGLKVWVLMWFLTMQKLPFMGVLMMLLSNLVFYFLLFGFFFCYFQLLMVKDYKFMLVLNSTESFNWILLGYIFSFFNGLVVFLYYFFLSCYMIPFWGVESKLDFEWLVVFFYVNVPLGVPFFVKFFVVSYVFGFYYIWFVLVMFIMFICFLSLSVWLFLKSMESSFGVFKMGSFFYVVFGLFFVLLL